MPRATAANPWMIGSTVGYARKHAYTGVFFLENMQIYLQFVKVSASVLLLSRELARKFAWGPSHRSSTACLTNFKLGLAED